MKSNHEDDVNNGDAVMRNIHLPLLMAMILSVAGCQSTPSAPTGVKPTSSQIIYSACLETETPKIKAKGDKDPELVAHYVCQIVAGTCMEKPASNPCQRSFKEYELTLNKRGQSLLHQSAHIGDSRLVQAIVNTGVNVDYAIRGMPGIKAGAGWTPLMLAVAEGHEKTASVLIKSGANVNARNSLGRTPLMYASKYGFYSIARMLLQKGAKTDVIPNDDNGRTALMAAAYAGHDDIVELLLENGADPGIKDKQGKTALMLAQDQGHSRVVKVLQSAR